ncbi:TPA: tyrosine-protein kinase Wzc [Serratia marcescens]|jgi:tyrosine-protein kinase Etk/Wzc|uniref:Tyrosine kinase n=6 Tax=Pseudomonadota TaxID=1224 RepID=A0ABC9IFG1_SERMA|nr:MULTISPECIES: tyrosine-protein kinase Wzc [Serratia]MBH3169037.1 tyrosine-protein kinase Wzc [Serratia marcescens]MBK5576357.1 tyrosine-protein kinase Wzc [Serratia marcescens]MBN5346346.1 tyrosine-protein kinase Wzc [Serratia marcescens]MBN5402055.1 tyrosine-protein kinase Wzc [Serratia marcescens]MDN6877577.1 tyrosine-protein kinase Wzc [Serratia bockelmannii]
MIDKNRTSSLASKENDEIDFGRLLGTLVDHKWLIVSITSLFAVIGIIYSLFATPIYQADATVQVEQNEGNMLVSNLSQMLPNSLPASSTEIELISSRMIVGKTVEDLHLDTVVTQKYFPIFGRGWARLMGNKPGQVALSRLTVAEPLVESAIELEVIDDQNYVVTVDKDKIFQGKVGRLENASGVSMLVSEISAKPGTVFNVKKLTTLAATVQLLDDLTVEDKGKDTGVLSLTLMGDDPVLIKRIIESISNNYLIQNVERKSEEAAKSLAFLKEQLPQVRDSLNTAEDKLNSFRQANDSVDLSLEAKSVLDTIVGVEAQLNELTFKESEISKLYTKEHPAYRALLEKRATLQKEKDKLNQRVSKMPQTQQEILRLTRDVDAGKEIYMQLLNRQQELSITKASTVGNVRIIDTAVTQPKPVKPKKTLIVIIFTLLGGIASVAVVLLKSVLHRGIESPEQLEDQGINVYASIPLSEWQQKKDIEMLMRGNKKTNTRSKTLLAVGNPADLAIEAVRSLRTSLHFAMLEAKNNVLMVCGASPNIGKTFVSINLAAVIAQAGQRVLVIDADMRKGYSHSLLNTDWHNGLSDILSAQTTMANSVRKTEIENLDFIPRGQIPPNPSELLMGARFNELIDWASKNYDIVMIDTPPILAVTDAAIIGHRAGTSLMIARFASNTVKEIEVSIRRFNQNGIDVKGVILNAVEKRASSYYGDYGYYQYEYRSNDKA